MTPSQQAKKAGLKSLAQASYMSTIPVSTLKDWFGNYPDRFDFVIKSCVLINKNNLAGDNGGEHF